MNEPTFTIEGNIFTESVQDRVWSENAESLDIDEYPTVDSLSPIDYAKTAWEQVVSWVNHGYLPIITVTLSDGSKFDVDLEEDRFGVSGDL